MDEDREEPLRDPFPTGAPASASAVEDLSELLEELPEETEEDTLEILDEPIPEPIRPVAPVPIAGRAPAAGARVPTARAATGVAQVPVRRAGPAPGHLQVGGGEAISPLDPLGIAGGRGGEMPLSRTVQVGAVSPGKEHRITVPLEMSVGGRRVRLSLRMILTVSD